MHRRYVAPPFRIQLWSIYYDPVPTGIGPIVTVWARAMRERGHDVEVAGEWALGRVSAAARENGLLKAAANPRGMQGYAVGR